MSILPHEATAWGQVSLKSLVLQCHWNLRAGATCFTGSRQAAAFVSSQEESSGQKVVRREQLRAVCPEPEHPQPC